MSLQDAIEDILRVDTGLYALIDNRIYPGVSPSMSTGLLFLKANPTDGDTVTIGLTTGKSPTSQTYRFKTIIAVANDVLLDAADVDVSIGNLIAAIGLGSGSGTKYEASTVKHTAVFAIAQVASTMSVLTKKRSNKDFALSETFTDGLSVWQSSAMRVYPYVILTLEANRPGRDLSGALTISQARQFIDIISPSTVDNEAVADVIRLLLHAKHDNTTIGTPPVAVASITLNEEDPALYREPEDQSEVGLYRWRQDYNIWYTPS